MKNKRNNSKNTEQSHGAHSLIFNVLFLFYYYYYFAFCVNDIMAQNYPLT